MSAYTLQFITGRGWVTIPVSEEPPVVQANRAPTVTSAILEAFEDNFWLAETDSFWQTPEAPEESPKSKYPTYAAECDLPDCTICQKPIKKGEKITRLPCDNEVSHAFHKDCISPWLRNNSTCPNCRSEV